MVARHRLRVRAAAGHEAGDVAASGRSAEAAVAGVQAPAHGVRRVRQRAVRDPLHGHEDVARLHLAGDALAVRQVLVLDAVVRDDPGDAGLQSVRNALRVGTGDHFQAAVLAPGGGQRDPQVEDHGVADVLGKVRVVLVPGHVGGVVLGELHPQHRLRMGQDLRPDHGLDGVEQGRMGAQRVHAGCLVPLAVQPAPDPGEGLLVQLAGDRGQAPVEGLVREGGGGIQALPDDELLDRLLHGGGEIVREGLEGRPRQQPGEDQVAPFVELRALRLGQTGAVFHTGAIERRRAPP